MLEKTVRTEACEIFGIEHPVILAGMGALGRATPPPLVAAVSNAGGLGVFSGSGLSPEEVRHRIHLVRGLTDKPFGVDLLLPAIMADVEETRTQVRNTLREQYPKHVAFSMRVRNRQ